MAAPTTVEVKEPQYSLTISGTNISAGNNDYPLDYLAQNLQYGFSILTGTLTATNVTLWAYNIDSTMAVDVTTDICGVATLASSKVYIVDIKLPVREFFLRVARSNATNASYVEIFAPRR